MKISVDHNRCEGHGLCTERSPALFQLDDDAELVYHFKDDTVPQEHVAAARAAINSCPVAALREIA